MDKSQTIIHMVTGMTTTTRRRMVKGKVWRLAAAVCLLCVFQSAECREVSLPPGPLYRVAGFPLSLPCSVSGYEGPRTQDFEWFLYREDAAGRQMGVVSTRDQGFPYAPFQGRVRAGEVRVERDAGNRARLVVQRLRAEDQGRYECYTPSTDTKYLGNYSASVTVKVIPDTLQISYSRSLTGQPLPEGADLQLTCSAGVQSEQHTHVSVTFGVRGGPGGPGGPGAGVREVISVDKELVVKPGDTSSYGKRYDDGEISLEKRGMEAGRHVYVMKMKAVVPEDSGTFFCEVAQWILDPVGHWVKIAQRTLDIGNLTVLPLAKSLEVTSSPRGEVTLQTGSPLTLTCEVGGLPVGGRSSLLVQWMKRGSGGSKEVEVARSGPDGVVSWGEEGRGGGGGGGGAMEQEGEGRYALRLFSARPGDSGVYVCAVSVFAGGSQGRPAITRRSEGVTVNLKTKEVLVSAGAELARGPLLKRGSTITLLCNVSVVTTGSAQVEVSWLRGPLQEPVTSSAGDEEEAGTLFAALSYDGLARSYGNGSEASVERMTAGCYRLRIHAAEPEDQGRYRCQAEVWGQDPHGGWYNTGAKARSSSVRVYLYARAADLLLLPLVIGVSSALFVGIVIIATVTCCFMKRLARQRSPK